MIEQINLPHILVNTDISLDRLIRANPNLNEIDFEQIQLTFNDFAKREIAIKRNIKQLSNLLQIGKIPQKSQEWYKIRNSMITASDWGQALGEGKYGTEKELIKKKCLPQDVLGHGFKENKFFRWGNMFEDVAIEIYSKEMNVKIHEFGLIQHPKLSWFGASPDGISETGVMLEIKCPLKRKLDGTVLKQYFYQIQGQLEVCDLEECDFFECDIQQYLDKNDFFDHLADDTTKGIVIECNEYLDAQSRFKYSKIAYGNGSELQEDYVTFIKTNSDNQRDICYWYLSKCCLQRIYRDQKFIDTNLDKLFKVWKKILHYRDNDVDFKRDIVQRIAIETEDYKDTKYAFKDDFITEIYY